MSRSQPQFRAEDSSTRELLLSWETLVQFGLFVLMLAVGAPVLSEALSAVTFGILDATSWVGFALGVLIGIIVAVGLRLSQA